MFEKYNEKARRALFFARYESSKLGSRVIKSEHVLLGILREGEDSVLELLSRFNVKPEDLRREIEGERVFAERLSSTAELPLSEETKKILAYAAHEAESMLHKTVGSEHLIIGLLRAESSLAQRILVHSGLDLIKVREAVVTIAREREASQQKKELPFLTEYGRDLTSLAAQQELCSTVGLRTGIEQAIQILSSHTKRNPMLIGEPGVGKTSIVEGLAQFMASEDVPAFLGPKRIFALDLSLLDLPLAGSRKSGRFPTPDGILAELEGGGDFIVFMNDIHLLLGAGTLGANLLKQALLRGRFSCIGATTPREYPNIKDSSFLRGFQAIRVNPPSAEETYRILCGATQRFGSFHKVRYSDSAIRRAVFQADRYLQGHAQPGKAIRVIDDAGARVKLRRAHEIQGLRHLEEELSITRIEMKSSISAKDFEEAVKLREREIKLREEVDRMKGVDGSTTLEVTGRDIDEVIASLTGIPVEAEHFMRMEDALRSRVVGQDRAISAISRAIRRSRLGVPYPRRPVGSFFFLGPPGVGKTEIARRLAELLSRNALIRCGRVGHGEGRQLAERVRRHPFSVVLFEEIEKAPMDAANLPLQILEEGHLVDACGNTVDFTQTIVLMTTNIGGRTGSDESGHEQSSERHEEEALTELRRSVSPELVDLVDDVIVFNPLGMNELRAIVDILMKDMNARLAERRLEVRLAPEAREWLLQEASLDLSAGARPLHRAFRRHVQDAVSELLIYPDGEKMERIEVSVKDGELRLEVAGCEGVPES